VLEESDTELDIPDRRLALMFACAHPAIEPGIRAPLMLQLVLGFDAARIASAFLVAPSTMGQRLSRAKNKIRTAGIPLRIPEREEWPERLAAVLDAVYAAFAEGWSDAGELDSGRRDLAEEALFLGDRVAVLTPGPGHVRTIVDVPFAKEERSWAALNGHAHFGPLRDRLLSLVRVPDRVAI